MTLTENHIDYAHAVAAQMRSQSPSYITLKDLRAAAEFGLVQAAHSFDDRRDVTFTTFAYYRIRGAILDFLRETARTSRVERQYNDYSEEKGKRWDDAVNAENDLSPAQADEGESAAFSDAIWGDIPEPAHHARFCEQLIQREQRQRMRKAVRRLPARSRELLEAYYFESHTLAEVGAQMSLSKSWLSRLHARSISLLREELERQTHPKPSKPGIEKVLPFPVPKPLPIPLRASA